MALARRSSPRALPPAIALAILLAAGARGETPAILDCLELSSAASRSTHAVAMSQAAVRTDRAMVGACLEPIPGVAIRAGGALRAHMRADAAAGRRVALLVTLATAPRDYGKRQRYHIRIDDRTLYAASERDPGGGTSRSLFLDLGDARPSYEVAIAAEPTSEAPVTVSALRLYADLDSPAVRRALGAQTPLAVSVLSRQEGGRRIDAAEAAALRALIPRSPYAKGEAAVLVDHCNLSAAGIRARIEELAAVAARSDVPVRIVPRSDGIGTPVGVSDAAGGVFGDAPYRQIYFDARDKGEDAVAKELLGNRYAPGFHLAPAPGGGPAPLSLNQPRLNQLRRLRLTALVQVWQRARWRLAGAGRESLLPLGLSTGDAALYVAPAGAVGDFNPFAILDAMAARLDLDPRNGLSGKERWWLHQNRAHFEESLVEWMAAALAKEPAPVTPGGTVRYAADTPALNLFTEPYAPPCVPYADPEQSHPGVEAGYVPGAHTGARYAPNVDALAWLPRQRDRGRIALVGLPADARLLRSLRAAFGFGARYVVVETAGGDPGQAIREMVAGIGAPGGGGRAAEFRPTSAQASGASARRVFAMPAGCWAIDRVTVFAIGPGGGLVRLTVRPKGGDSFSTTVPVPPGAGPRPTAVLLPAPIVLMPGAECEVIAQPLGGAAPLAAAADGRLALLAEGDLLAERARSLAIQQWRDAEDLLGRLEREVRQPGQSFFATDALSRAEGLLAAGRPQEAYRTAIQAQQIATPAPFLVPAPGARLTPYWVNVRGLKAPVRAIVTRYTPRSVTLSLTSAAAQTALLTWGTKDTPVTLSAGVTAEVTLVAPVRRPRRPRPKRLPAPATPAAAPTRPQTTLRRS